MPLKTYPYDPAKYFTDPEAQADLLNDALESGHAGYIADALGVIARARGISKLARDTGLTRMGLHKALSKEGDPKLTTVVKVLATMKLKLMATPVKASARDGKGRRKPRRSVAA